MWGKVVIIALLVAPIWRDPSWEGGVSAIQAVKNLATLPQKEHVSVQEAIDLCTEAYEQNR